LIDVVVVVVVVFIVVDVRILLVMIHSISDNDGPCVRRVRDVSYFHLRDRCSVRDASDVHNGGPPAVRPPTSCL
jgi:hypothetical protein